jgi:hypothetical protein
LYRIDVFNVLNNEQGLGEKNIRSNFGKLVVTTQRWVRIQFIYYYFTNSDIEVIDDGGTRSSRWQMQIGYRYILTVFSARIELSPVALTYLFLSKTIHYVRNPKIYSLWLNFTWPSGIGSYRHSGFFWERLQEPQRLCLHYVVKLIVELFMATVQLSLWALSIQRY